MIPQTYRIEMMGSFSDEMLKIAAGEGLLMKILSKVKAAPSAIRSALPGSAGAMERATLRETGKSGRILRGSKSKMNEAVKMEGAVAPATTAPATSVVKQTAKAAPVKPPTMKQVKKKAIGASGVRKGVGIAVGGTLATAGGATALGTHMLGNNPGMPRPAMYPGGYR